MNATIVDVARLAGVSTATVSRALHGSGNVDTLTREKVLRAAETLSYRPSEVARSLARGRTASIGIIVTQISNPYYADLVSEMEDEARDAGYNIFLSTSRDDPARERAYIDLLAERRIDGVIVACSGLAEHRPETLRRARFPIVLANSDGSDLGIPSVSSDHYKGAYDLTSYLLGLGHARVAHMRGPDDVQSTRLRLRGFRDALRDAGLDPAACPVVVGGDASTGERAMQRLLSLPSVPSAVFAYNDFAAVGAVHACAQADLSVPGDISIAGFDNLQISALMSPPLTTMAQSTREIGRRAVRMLLDVLQQGGSGENLVLGCELVERASCAPVRKEASA